MLGLTKEKIVLNACREITSYVSGVFFNELDINRNWILNFQLSNDEFYIEAYNNETMEIKQTTAVKQDSLFVVNDEDEIKSIFPVNADTLDKIFIELANMTNKKYKKIEDILSNETNLPTFSHNGFFSFLMNDDYRIKLPFADLQYYDEELSMVIDSFNPRIAIFETLDSYIIQPKIYLTQAIFLQLTGKDPLKSIFSDDVLREINDALLGLRIHTNF